MTQILTKQMFLKTTGNLFIRNTGKLMIMGLTICFYDYETGIVTFNFDGLKMFNEDRRFVWEIYERIAEEFNMMKEFIEGDE